MTGNLLRKLIYSQRHVAFLKYKPGSTRRGFTRSENLPASGGKPPFWPQRAGHARQPSTLSRQIQRLEEDLGQPLFVRDNRTVTLTEAGKSCAFAQQTLLQYQQLRHTSISKVRRCPASCISSVR
jgi:LysR family positive regulator for ilvC